MSTNGSSTRDLLRMEEVTAGYAHDIDILQDV